MSHIKRVLFTPELLVTLVRGRFEVTYNGLPTDVQVRGCAYDTDRAAVTLYVEHDSFADAPLGDVIPIAEPPIIRTLDFPSGAAPESAADVALLREAREAFKEIETRVREDNTADGLHGVYLDTERVERLMAFMARLAARLAP